MLIIPCISLKQKDSPSRLSPMPLDSKNNKKMAINKLGRLGGPPQISISNNGRKKLGNCRKLGIRISLMPVKDHRLRL